MAKSATSTWFGSSQDHYSAFLAAGNMLMDDESPEASAVNELLERLADVVAGVGFDQALINSPGGGELDDLLAWAEDTARADVTTHELVRSLRLRAI